VPIGSLDALRGAPRAMKAKTSIKAGPTIVNNA
jgi:hypothetical protein